MGGGRGGGRGGGGEGARERERERERDHRGRYTSRCTVTSTNPRLATLAAAPCPLGASRHALIEPHGGNVCETEGESGRVRESQ